MPGLPLLLHQPKRQLPPQLTYLAGHGNRLLRLSRNHAAGDQLLFC